MAHHTLKTSYSGLVDQLNRFPQGAAPSDLLNKILKVLFSDKEAQLISLLPIKPFTTEKASRIWKTGLKTIRNFFKHFLYFLNHLIRNIKMSYKPYFLRGQSHGMYIIFVQRM